MNDNDPLEFERSAAAEAWGDVAAPVGAIVSLGALLLLGLTGCGFGQLGPETSIVADTPCGRIEYHSTKDQAQPNATCSIGRDGEALFEVGSASASGAGVVAQSVASAILGAIKVAK